MRLSDENLRGRTVIGADGQAIGEVAALFLDSVAWGIQSIQVKLRKEIADQLGATRSVFRAGTVEIPIRLFSPLATRSCSPSPSMGFGRYSPSRTTTSLRSTDGRRSPGSSVQGKQKH
jgi:hypothetical protein